ncbi:MAG: tachylectin-related carbohydrate-binding protein [Gammaproteobacteria bacterium]
MRPRSLMTRLAATAAAMLITVSASAALPDAPQEITEDQLKKIGEVWIKSGGDLEGKKAFDVTFATISAIYPPAGEALKIAFNVMIWMGGGLDKPDPVQTAIQRINERLNALSEVVLQLHERMLLLGNLVFAEQNDRKLMTLLDRKTEIEALIQRFKSDPVANRRGIAAEAMIRTNRYLPDNRLDESLWHWSDLRVRRDEKGKIWATMQPAEFRILPTYEFYASSLIFTIAAMQSLGNPQYVVRTFGRDLERHARFLSVRPFWAENHPEAAPESLPEIIKTRVRCQTTVHGPSGGDNMCAALDSCTDDMTKQTFRETIPFPASRDQQSGIYACFNTRAEPRPVTAAEQAQRVSLFTQQPIYGTQALEEYERYNRGRLPLTTIEPDLERRYLVQAMAVLADKLSYLARYGSLPREELVAPFENRHTWDHPLYAVKQDGELLWHRHRVAIDRSPAPMPPTVGSQVAEAEIQGQATNSNVFRSSAIKSAMQPRSAAAGGAAPAGGAATPAPKAEELTPPSRPVLKVANSTRPPPARVKHAFDGPVGLGTGWQDFRAVIPAGDSRAGASFYGLTRDGVLKWYRHEGVADGSNRWKGPIDVGTGWHVYSKIIASGEGVLYGIGTDGMLRWYRHGDFANTSDAPRWSGPRVVGQSWGHFTHVFSTGEGVIYAVHPNGRLYWYQHLGYLSGEVRWKGPRAVAMDWSQFSRVVSPGLGMLYAIKANGELLWYQHEGWRDGTNRWLGPTQLSAGWNEFLHVFPRMPGSPDPVN